MHPWIHAYPAALPKTCFGGNLRQCRDAFQQPFMGKAGAPGPEEAAVWFRRAVEQGHPAAQLKLGVMLAKGEGVPQDWESSYFWLSLAATQDSRSKTVKDIAALGLAPEKMSEIQAHVSAWKPRLEVSKSR